MRLGLGLGLAYRSGAGGFDPDRFVVVFDTNLRAGSTTVELNVNARTGGDRFVDWGDGTVTVENAALPSHTYAADGVYVVQMWGGTTTRLGERGGSTNAGWTATLIEVVQWGKAVGWTSFQDGCRVCANNVKVPGEIPRTADGYAANVTSLSSAFRDTTAFNQPLNSWNVSNVTNMAAMFASATAFNQPLNSWNVSAVTDMFGMFSSATAFNQNLGAWVLRTAGVTMTNMLNNAGLSTENYSRTLIGWSNSVRDNGALPSGVTLGATGRTYNATAYEPTLHFTNAVDARAYLVAAAPDPAWTITDGGQA